MKSMNTPRTRAEFERNFHLLRRQIEDGRLKFSEQVKHSIEGLLNVRFLPNGRIDFLSVDESARLQANMTAQFDEEKFEQLKQESMAVEEKDATESGNEPKP
jgi:hypothetical protein